MFHLIEIFSSIFCIFERDLEFFKLYYVYFKNNLSQLFTNLTNIARHADCIRTTLILYILFDRRILYFFRAWKNIHNDWRSSAAFERAAYFVIYSTSDARARGQKPKKEGFALTEEYLYCSRTAINPVFVTLFMK